MTSRRADGTSRRMKRIRAQIAGFVCAIAVLIAAASCGMPGPDLAFATDERQAMADAVRIVFAGGETNAALAVLPEPFSTPMHREVFVGVYKGGSLATAGAREATLGASLVAAAAGVRKDLVRSGLDPRDADLGITIDVLNARGSMPTTHPELAPLFLASGVDGVYAERDGRTTYLLPSAIHLEPLDPRKVAGMVRNGEGVSIPGDATASDTVYRFRTDQTGQRAADAPALPLYRTNYLLGEVTSDDLRTACILGGRALVATQRASGRFDYYYYPAQDRRYSSRRKRDEYNYLRHAGTTYSLFQLYQATGLDEFADAAENATQWMLRFIRRAPDGSFSYPYYAGQSKLGGAGLALLALVERAEATGKTDQDKTMDELAAFIASMQREDGSFDSYYEPNPKRKAKVRTSIYYPGEAILALIRLHALRGRPDALAVAVKGADYLVDKRWDLLGIQITIPPDAWLMLALSDLYAFHPDAGHADYCLAIGDEMLRGQIGDGDTPYADYAGGYVPMPPSITPAGARMEGITAGYRLRQQIGVPTDAWYEAIRRAARFQVNAQIREPSAFLFPNPARALGVFRNVAEPETISFTRGSKIAMPHVNTRYKGLHKMRIDYNQHNISGLLVAAEILSERGL